MTKNITLLLLKFRHATSKQWIIVQYCTIISIQQIPPHACLWYYVQYAHVTAMQQSHDSHMTVVVLRVRELTTDKVGTLLRISGQVVRTHPVHPELVSGTFMCLECQTTITGIEQQFKYAQVGVASTHARMTRLHLHSQRLVVIQTVQTGRGSYWTWRTQSLWTSRKSVYKRLSKNCHEEAYLGGKINLITINNNMTYTISLYTMRTHAVEIIIHIILFIIILWPNYTLTITIS